MENPVKAPEIERPPGTGLRGLFANRERLDDWCGRGIFGLVVAILVYSPLAIGSVRLKEFVVVEWLTAVVLALWLCRFWLNPKHRLLWPPVCWGVVAFMGYAVVRYLTADIEYVARQETIKVLVYGFLFLAILHNLYHLEKIQFVGMTLVFLAMAIALYALFQYLTGSDYVFGLLRTGNYHKRGSGTFFCPNHLAGYLELLLPLALAYTLTSRLSHVLKIMLAYASLAIFTGIVVSVSMGGWIATGLTMLIFLAWLLKWRDYRMQTLLVGGGLVAIATLFITMAELSPNRLDHFSTALKADDIRMRLWGPAIQMWRDHFWFGAGPAHFDYLFAQYRPGDPFPEHMQWDPLRVHNDYLNTLSDWGLVGALLVLAAWVLFYSSVFRSWKFVQRAQNDLAAKRSNKASFVMGGALGLFAILIHSVVDFNMHIPANAILVITLLALVSAHFRYATEAYWHTAHLPLRIVITILLLGGIVYLGQQSWRQSRETYWLGEAKALKFDSDERLDALKKALQAEPGNYATPYRLGETYRLMSWNGGDNYRAQAKEALKYFGESIKLNQYYPYSLIRYGMCLDWLGQHAEAEPYFLKASRLDTNGYFTAAHVGWHYVQVNDWFKSKEWFLRSLHLLNTSNQMASAYLEIVNRRIAELENPK